VQWREWDMSIGPAFGQAGTQQVLTAQVQCLFRGEKLMATDTGSTPGRGTRIMQFVVGQKIQRPTASGSTLVDFFSPVALGNGIRWDTCQPGVTISVTVSFVESCTFDMTVFGKAVI
jgi:hypothetical protein